MGPGGHILGMNGREGPEAQDPSVYVGQRVLGLGACPLPERAKVRP